MKMREPFFCMIYLPTQNLYSPTRVCSHSDNDRYLLKINKNESLFY